MIMALLISLTLISCTLMVMNFLFSMKMKMNREKHSVFECGFDPSNSSRLPFSMHFFLIALIFLIFDVEISLLIPIPCLWSTTKSYTLTWVILSVMLILLMGSLIEWAEGSLDWKA